MRVAVLGAGFGGLELTTRLSERFGDEIATLVDGVTKLTGITFTSRDEAQAENYRKMMVAMATDIRVILIKLADRLHNMRTIGAMPKQNFFFNYLGSS